MHLAERSRDAGHSRGPSILGLSVVMMLVSAPEAHAAEDSGDPLRSGIIASSALVGAWTLSELAPESWSATTCRICESNGIDRGARDHLVWEHREVAADFSDALVLGIPISSIGTSFLIGQQRSIRQGVTDGLVVAEAIAIASLGTAAVKTAAARRRPYAYYETGAYPESHDENLSFWSGHTAVAFSAAASLATVAYHHDWPGLPWIAAGGVLAAGTVGYLRIGADKHWLTDVLAGCAFGTAVGVAVPLLELGPRKDGARVTMTVMPIGVMGAF